MQDQWDMLKVLEAKYDVKFPQREKIEFWGKSKDSAA